MSRFLALSLAVTMSVGLAAWFRGRSEVAAVATANQSLRKTLGELTLELTAKEKEIDRLSQLPCPGSGSASRGTEK